MSLAVKHFDPVIGVDVHIVATPAGPIPMPHPFVGMILDPFDYIPIIGSTVLVNGVHRGIAGSVGINALRHIPLAGSFIKFPANECEMFMGSQKVTMDGDAASYLGLSALSCQDIGMSTPPRSNPKKGTKLKTLVLPSSVVLPVPAGSPVNVNGPPTISLAAIAGHVALSQLGKGLKAAKKAVGRSGAVRTALKKFSALKKRVFKNLPPGVLKCNILKAEPVNAITGEVLLAQLDFDLPWRVPLRWIRSYGSQNTYRGVCGVGWETPADARLIRTGAETYQFHDGSLSTSHFHLADGEARDPLNGSVLIIEQGADQAAEPGAESSAERGVARVRDSAGLTYHFLLDNSRQAARLQRLSDAAGNGIDFIWSAHGALLAMYESSGIKIVATHDEFADLTSLTLHHPQFEPRLLNRYRQTRSHNLIEVEDSAGHVYTLSYSGDHRLAMHTDRNGLSFRYDYQQIDGEYRCVHTFGDGKLYDYQFDYQPHAQQTQVTNSLGHKTSFCYNDQFLPVEEINALDQHTYYEYDPFGRTTAVINQKGLRTSFEYDAHGNVIRETNPLGHSQQRRFDDLGRMVSITSPRGHSAAIEWNAQDRVAQETDAGGHCWLYTYNRHGDITLATDPHGHETRFRYDPNGQLIAIQDALKRETQRCFDDLGNVTKIIEPGGFESRFDYDARGLLTVQTNPNGVAERFGYDREGQLVSFLDGEQRLTRYVYYGLGELGKIIHPDKSEVIYEYDTEEQVIAVVNERGERYQFDYDAAGRVVSTTDYWGAQTCYVYDELDNPVTIMDALQRETTQTFDDAGRVTERRYADGDYAQFEFDDDGNAVSIRSRDHHVRRAYDPLGSVEEEWQDDVKINYRFDPLGRLSLRQTNDNRVQYDYDPLGRVSAVSVNDKQIVRRHYPQSEDTIVDDLLSGIRRERVFDADKRLVSQTTARGGDTLSGRRFAYDRVANLIERHDVKKGSQRFGYNNRDRLNEWVDDAGAMHNYLPDEAGDLLRHRAKVKAIGTVTGNDTTAIATPIARTAVTEGVAYEYDAVGNVTRKRYGVDLEIDLKFNWDARNRLHSAETAQGTVKFDYDPFGRRLRKWSASSDTRFHWEGDRLLSDHKGDLSREFVYEPDGFVPLCAVDQDGRVQYYETDQIGLCHEVFDETGEILWSGRFDAQGRPENASEICPFRFQGQYFDVETGIVYNRYRYFDAGTSSFLSVDPIGLAGGVNLYGNGENVWGWGDGVGLSCNKSNVTEEGTTRVGRWMGKTEHEAMVNSGNVIESKLGGVTSVTTPPNATAWIRQTDGSRFVEFDVPSSTIRASDGVTGKIFGPNSFLGPKKGITEMPPASNIQQTVSKWPRME